MKLKRVSFDVAKALKEAGYPQTIEGEFASYYDVITGHLYVHSYKVLINPDWICDAPTYIEVSLWLWREKKISVYTEECLGSWAVFELGSGYSREGYIYNDPEEAIIAAIEYLVDNDLIK